MIRFWQPIRICGVTYLGISKCRRMQEIKMTYSIQAWRAHRVFRGSRVQPLIIYRCPQVSKRCRSTISWTKTEEEIQLGPWVAHLEEESHIKRIMAKIISNLAWPVCHSQVKQTMTHWIAARSQIRISFGAAAISIPWKWLGPQRNQQCLAGPLLSRVKWIVTI